MPNKANPFGMQSSVSHMAGAMRAIGIVMAVAFGAGALLNLAAGRSLTAASSLVGAVGGIAAWRWALSGSGVTVSSIIAFFSIACAVTGFLWAGNGTRDYGLAGYPSVLFLGSVFLGTRAYWSLAACIVLAITFISLAEINGIKVVPGPPPEWRNLFNLWLIIGASAVGGRILLQAFVAGIKRETRLAGALESSEERMQKLLRSSQNAIVVSRLADGQYLEVNDTFQTMFGFTREEVVGRTSLELGVWESASERARFLALLDGGDAVRDFEARQRKKSGEWIEVLIAAERLVRDGTDCLLISVTDITSRLAAERRAEYLSTRDALTGLPNRVLALDRLQQALARAGELGGAVMVMHVNIDHLKGVNQAVGRQNGDALLRETCSRLQALSRSGDTLARVGGNELLIIACRPASDSAEVAAEAVLGAFGHAFTVAGQSIRVTCSVGVSVFPADAGDGESLLLNADTAMHEAKRAGRACFRLYSRVMSERFRNRLAMESGLRESIANGSLKLVYQPKYDFKTGALCGVEALARWHHPTLGNIPPAVFIPLAEESDLICDLGLWVLRQASNQIANWRDAGLPLLPVAVNLSARQITSALPREVFDCVHQRGIATHLIELEVTETMLIAQPAQSRNVLEQVSRQGSRIVLDDFGVGYSSLGYVKLLPLNGIKIDRSFVADVVYSREDRAIVSAVVGLAHGLGMRVIAEGIENAQQLDVLKQLGCDEGQGYHLCRPVSEIDIARRISAPEVMPA